nr:MAG TPA: hypothetical protein [Caudoviricetes sp.]
MFFISIPPVIYLFNSISPRYCSYPSLKAAI